METKLGPLAPCAHSPDQIYKIEQLYTSDTLETFLECECGVAVSNSIFNEHRVGDTKGLPRKTKYVPTGAEIQQRK